MLWRGGCRRGACLQPLTLSWSVLAERSWPGWVSWTPASQEPVKAISPLPGPTGRQMALSLGAEGSLTAVPLHGLAGRLKVFTLPEESCLSPKNRGCWGRVLQHPPTWCDL